MSRFLLFLFVSPLVFGQIQGIVVDQGNQAPIENAIVRIQAQTEFATTDQGGFFQLNDTASFPFTLTASVYTYDKQDLDPHTYYTGSVIVTASSPTNLMIELERMSTSIIPNFPLNAPVECQGCHPDQVTQWQDSPMQKTGLNTWVFDLYDGQGSAGGNQGFVYQRDSIHRFAKPNSDCSACHSPVHWLTDIQNAGMGDITNPNEDMEHGVQCEVCHRALDVDDQKLNFPGVMPESFTFLRNSEPIEFGLLTDVDYIGGPMRAAYNPQLAAQTCAACHEDNVDHDDDDDFEDPGSVPHETTYSEWQAYRQLNGPNSATCVDCHMPSTGATELCIPLPITRLAGTIRSHDIRGTTATYLENAVELSVDSRTELGSIHLDVTLTNSATGHAVPTGIMLRNMILLVDVRDSSGQSVPLISGDRVDEVGGIGDPNNGYVAGLPGKAFFKNMTDGTDERVFYTEATGFIFDNRLQPGQSYNGDFAFGLPAGTGSSHLDVDVRVIYRRAYREVIDTKQWTTTGHGELLADLQPPHFGHLMEQVQSALDPCADKDLNTSGTINQADFDLLLPLWTEPAPFDQSSAPQTNVRHMIALLHCSD